MANERIDVSAVLANVQGIHERIARVFPDMDSPESVVADLKKARAAVAELIEKASAVAYAFMSDAGDHVHGFCLGIDEVRDLRAALARVGGAP